jgi:hypothetical protein
MENAKKEAETLHITGTQLCSQHILEQAYTRVDAQGERPVRQAACTAYGTAALQLPAGQAACMQVGMRHSTSIITKMQSAAACLSSTSPGCLPDPHCQGNTSSHNMPLDSDAQHPP